MSEAGVEIAWLACAIGNEPAARFYEKCGWRRAGIVINQLETLNGTFPLDVWRYEKRLHETERLHDGGAQAGPTLRNDQVTSGLRPNDES